MQARAFYGFQIAIENIHSEMYSLMIDAYVKDTAEKDRLFHAVDHFDSVKRKAEWALKWTSRYVTPCHCHRAWTCVTRCLLACMRYALNAAASAALVSTEP
jgi:ribonucleotide reductase beta subunit family protein with ferritin-like domain